MNTQPQTLTDADVLVGNPFGSGIGEVEETTDQTDAQQAVETVDQVEKNLGVKSTGPIYLGSRKFNSMEELNAYVNGLETRNVHTPTVSSLTTTPQTTQEEPTDGVDLTTLIYEDPVKYQKIVEERAVKAAEAALNRKTKEMETRTQADKAWNDFYGKNADLNDYRDAVDFQLQKNWESIKNQPLDRAMELLASQTRTYLNKLRGKPTGQGSELPNGPVKTVGASGNVSPKPAQKPTVVSSFSDQVKALRRKAR